MVLEPEAESKNNSKFLLKAPKLGDVLIEKPRLLSQCPVQTVGKPLPSIQKKNVSKKKGELKKSSSESFHYWLEPGVSLPRCQTREASARMGAGDPVSDHFKTHSTSHKEPEPAISELTKIPSITPSASSWKFCREVNQRNYFPDVPSKSTVSLTFLSARLRSEKFNHGFRRQTRVYILFFEGSVSRAAEQEVCQCFCLSEIAAFAAGLLVPLEFKTGREFLKPSNALKQWELWVKRRKFQQNILCKRLGKKPCDLTLNSSDTYRKVVEDKILYSYARVPKADKWRGHPCRWEPERGIRKKERDCDDIQKQCPDYFFVKTKLQRGVVPQIEFVGLPLAIQKEKGVVLEDSIPAFQENMPRRKRRKYCMRKLMDKLKSHVIEMDELAVVGKKILPVRMRWSEEDNSKSLEEDEDFLESLQMKSEGEDLDSTEKTQKSSTMRPESVLCLSIQDEEIMGSYQENNKEQAHRLDETYTWKVEFGRNPIGTLVEQSLKIENRGTVVVTYRWERKKPEQGQSLHSLKPSYREPWLFFDRNSGVLVPGQTLDLTFYHFTRKPGIRTDTWHLVTEPPLLKSGDSCNVFFSAIATDDTWEKKTQRLTSHLNNRVGQTTAKDILELILYRVFDPRFGLRGIEYRSLFFEKDLFESHNPSLYYHSTVVEELKTIFQQISHPRQLEWDLSVDSLVELCKTYTTDQLLVCKISDLTRQLLGPNYVTESRDKIYRMSYQVLCKMVNFIESDDDYFAKCLLYKKRKEKRGKYRSVFGEFEENQSTADHLVSEEGGDKLVLEEGSDQLVSEEGGEKSVLEFYDDNFFDNTFLNYIRYEQMFCTKVYLRLCEAVQNIAGIIETARLLKRRDKNNF